MAHHHLSRKPSNRAVLGLVVFLAVVSLVVLLHSVDQSGARVAAQSTVEGDGHSRSPQATPTAVFSGTVLTVPEGQRQQASDEALSRETLAEAYTGVDVLDEVLGRAGDGTLRRIAVPILMYHYISVPPEDADVYRLDLSVTPENFRQQMQYIADAGYSVISLYDLNMALRWGAPLPPNPVVLTFDDGYIDVYTNAFPVLQELGFTATFFVVTARLDEGHHAYINWTQAREMADAGMSIESHTKDHPNLEGRDSAYLYYQIMGSIESIEAFTGRRPHILSYPSGRWDEAVLAAVREFGIWSAVTTEGGIEHTTDSTLLLRRVRISGDTDLPTFAALLRWNWARSDS